MISASEWIARKTPEILKFKIDGERTFMPEVRRYFTAVSRNLLDPPTVRPVIEKQYNRIVSRLLDVRMKDASREELRDAILEALALRAARDSDIINRTTDRHIQEAFRTAREELGVDATESVVDRVAGRVFKRMSDGRVSNIVVTETQAATEAGRDGIARRASEEIRTAVEEEDQDEARRIARWSGDYRTYRAAESIGDESTFAILSALSLAQKMWKDMDDKRVRPWHAEADGQRVPVDQPFVVKGELLMFPGDGSLGASVDNLARCRCFSMHV